MGYILPITHHTYNNYQYRMTEDKLSPHHINGTYKVVFHKISEEYKEHNDKNNTIKGKWRERKTEKTNKIPAYHIGTTEKAELTGKGGQINVQV